MSVPTWRDADQFAHEYRFKAGCCRKGSEARAEYERQAKWWEDYSRTVKDCTYDVDADKDGIRTYDSGRKERIRG